MQPERQISVALTGIGAALVIPEYLALSRHQNVAPGAGLFVGAVVGALGVFGGSLVASGHPARSARVLGMAIWVVIGLAFSGAVFVAAVHSAFWGRRLVFGVVGLLPLVGPILVAARRDRA
ncbi:MAG TPA: hypothetical protein VEU55_04950 [Gemmatimonadales bacterium]|nr:hypothetical protein [Gemmatimonadales bacterium]